MRSLLRGCLSLCLTFEHDVNGPNRDVVRRKRLQEVQCQLTERAIAQILLAEFFAIQPLIGRVQGMIGIQLKVCLIDVRRR